MEAGRAAVLRVKRKRSAEPAEALVLACKRLRSDPVQLAAQNTPPEGLERAAENNVFQLVATVRSQVLGRDGAGVEGILETTGVKLYPWSHTNPCLRWLPSPTALQEEPVQPLVRAALRPPQGSQQRIRRNLRTSVREIRQEGRYRVVSSRRSSGIPSGGLESEDTPGNPEAADDVGFQLFDLVHEEDPEAAAASSCDVSTRREESWAIDG